jgi:8-oxo-dGTP diphosphatase
MTASRVFGVREARQTYRERRATYAVILDADGRVACVAEESGLFLPGGGLEPGEDSVRALHREVAEECARTIEIIAPLESATQYLCTARGERYELQAAFFLARFTGNLARQAQHVLSWQSASPQPPAFFHECHRWAVAQACGDA